MADQKQLSQRMERLERRVAQLEQLVTPEHITETVRQELAAELAKEGDHGYSY